MTAWPPGHAKGYLDAFKYGIAQIWPGFRGEGSGCAGRADGLRSLVLFKAAVRSARERAASASCDGGVSMPCQRGAINDRLRPAMTERLSHSLADVA